MTFIFFLPLFSLLIFSWKEYFLRSGFYWDLVVCQWSLEEGLLLPRYWVRFYLKFKNYDLALELISVC